MAQYIEKDAVVAEIDKILDYADEHWDTDYVIGAQRFANKLQDAINSLPQEPVSEDLNEVITKVKTKISMCNGFNKRNREEVFALLDTIKMPKKEVSEDLEEEMTRYFSKNPIKHPTDWPALKNTALHFANWQKEQFEKERLAHCDELTPEQAQIESDFVVNHLKEHHRTPTFIDAIEYGMKLQ